MEEINTWKNFELASDIRWEKMVLDEELSPAVDILAMRTAVKGNLCSVKQFFFIVIVLLFALMLWSCSSHRNFSSSLSIDDLAKRSGVSLDFRLGVGDELKVSVWRHESLDSDYIVPPSGWLFFPLVGKLHVIGLTPFEIRDRIKDHLNKYYTDPQVVVEVTSYRSRRIYVLGAVNNPGVVYFGTPLSAVEAVSYAGGFTNDAKESGIVLARCGAQQEREIYKLNMKSFISKAEGGMDPLLESGDILYVPNTFMSDFSHFSMQIRDIISPVVQLERAIIYSEEARRVLRGERPRVIIAP
jgi:protein involved in polysaccharide export with SLBB domain